MKHVDRSTGGRLVEGLWVVEADSIAPSAWRNGGGQTRELLRLREEFPGADDWIVRVSLADIDADGAFSPFAGVTRCFAVISGAGVRLSWPDGEPDSVQRAHDEPLAFDGANAPFCRLLEGPTRDLNVMARAGHSATPVPATLQAPWREHGRARGRGVFTLRPLLLQRPNRPPLALRARTLAWWNEADSDARDRNDPDGEIASWLLTAAPDAPDAIAQSGAGPAAAMQRAAPPAYWIRWTDNQPRRR